MLSLGAFADTRLLCSNSVATTIKIASYFFTGGKFPLKFCKVAKNFTIKKMSENKLDINSYIRAMNNPDEDFAVIELQKINKILEKYKTIIIPQSCDPFFLNPIFDSLMSKKLELVDAAFRVIVLLVECYNIEFLKLIFSKMLDVALLRDCAIKPQILSIFKEILSNHEKYSKERSAKIFEILFPDLTRDIVSQQGENQSFIIELLSSVIENFGGFAKEEDVHLVLDKIVFFLKPDPSPEETIRLKLLATLAKEWSKYATKNDIDELMKHIKSPELNLTTVSLSIMSSIILYYPQPFGKYTEDLFQLFYAHRLLLNSQSQSTLATTEDDELDEEVNWDMDVVEPERLKNVQSAIESLAKLTAVFPDKMSPHMQELTDLMYDYIAYDIVDGDEVQNESDEDIEMELDENDMGDDDDDDDDGNEENDAVTSTGNEDSWKLRKASSTLGCTLVSTICRQAVVASLSDEERVNTIKRSLSDSDPASIKGAAMFLLGLVSNCKEEVCGETIDSLLQTMIGQVKPSAPNTVPILNILPQIIKAQHGIDESLICNLIDVFSTNLVEVESSSLLTIFNTIMLTMKCSSVLINSMAKLVCKAASIEDTKIISFILSTASQIFYFAEEASEEIEDLCCVVFRSMEKHNEAKSSSLIPLGIFASSFAEAKSTQNAISFIVNCVNERFLPRNSVSALTLIAASSQCKCLAGNNSLFNSLVSYMQGNDETLAYKALWTVYLLLENNIVADKEMFVPSILTLVSSSESRTTTRAVKTLHFVIENEAQVKKANACVASVLSRPMEESVMKACAEYLCYASHICMEDVEKVIFQTLEKEDVSVSDVAIIAGAVAALNKDGYLAKFEKGVANKKVSYIRALGELGSIVDLSGQQKLVSDLKLLSSPTNPRDVFSAAAFSSGCIAAGSINNILPSLLATVNEDEANFPTWLISIEALTNKLSIHSTKEKLVGKFDDIANFLLKEREQKVENIIPCAQSLASLAAIDSDFISRLIEIVNKRNDLSQLAAQAISTYMASSSEEVAMNYINEILSALDNKFPLASLSLLNALKSCIRHKSVVPIIISSISKIEECQKFCKEQIVIKCLGVTTVEEDAGVNMRCFALDFAYNLAQKDNSLYPRVVNDIVATLSDPNNEVLIKSMSIIEALAIVEPALISESTNDIIGALLYLYPPEDHDKRDLVDPLVKLVATIQVTQPLCPELDKMCIKYSTKPLFNQTKTKAKEAAESVNARSNNENETTSVALMKMKQLCPEAVNVFQ